MQFCPHLHCAIPWWYNPSSTRPNKFCQMKVAPNVFPLTYLMAELVKFCAQGPFQRGRWALSCKFWPISPKSIDSTIFYQYKPIKMSFFHFQPEWAFLGAHLGTKGALKSPKGAHCPKINRFWWNLISYHILPIQTYKKWVFWFSTRMGPFRGLLGHQMGPKGP